MRDVLRSVLFALLLLCGSVAGRAAWDLICQLFPR